MIKNLLNFHQFNLFERIFLFSFIIIITIIFTKAFVEFKNFKNYNYIFSLLFSFCQPIIQKTYIELKVLDYYPKIKYLLHFQSLQYRILNFLNNV